ncbi:MAG: hypothetical protein QM632_02185 [Micrococcaceae bacterium]
MMKALKNLVFPQECLMCQVPDVRWCVSCQEIFLSQNPALIAPKDEDAILPFPLAFFTFYSHGFDVLIRKYKTENHRHVAPFIALALAKALLLLLNTMDAHERIYLVPVPSSRHSRKNRGYDHVLIVVQQLVTQLQNPRISCSTLLKQGKKLDQAGMNLKSRQRNISKTMWISRKKASMLDKKALYIVVDDICTTGATLAEAARALSQAGAYTIAALTFALVP